MHRECRERFPRHRGLAIDVYRGTCVTHVPRCMPGSLTSGFIWSRWRGKRSRHSRCMRNPQFYVSGEAHYVKTRVSNTSNGIRMFFAICCALFLSVTNLIILFLYDYFTGTGAIFFLMPVGQPKWEINHVIPKEFCVYESKTKYNHNNFVWDILYQQNWGLSQNRLKIFKKRLGDREIIYRQTRFHEIWVSGEFWRDARHFRLSIYHGAI